MIRIFLLQYQQFINQKDRSAKFARYERQQRSRSHHSAAYGPLIQRQ